MTLDDCKLGDKLLNVKQVAEELEVSVVTVTRYHRQGLLPYVVNEKAIVRRGEVRLTPLSAVLAFERPAKGRPPVKENLEA